MSATAALPTEAVETLAAPAALHVPKELWLAAIFALAFVYLAFSENGLVLAESWEVAHEFFHDGRHLFGVACH